MRGRRGRILTFALACAIQCLPFTAHALTRSVLIEWEKVSGGSGYELELTRLIGGRREAAQIFSTEDASLKKDLTVGSYEIRLRALDDRGVPGDWGSPFPYIVRMPAPKISEPRDGSEIKPAPRAPTQKINVAWEAVPEAKAYLVEILNSREKVVDRQRIEGLSYSRELPMGKSYSARVAVLQEGDGRGDYSSHSFTILNSIEKTRLATAKFHLGSLSYESKNLQVGSIVTAKPSLSGATFALEFRPKGLWDFGATADLSSLNFGTQSASLMNFEFFSHRRIEAWAGSAQYYALMGIAYAEMGEILGTSSQNFTIGKISAVGPFFGMKRTSELTDRLNLELGARAGFSLLGLSTPSGMGLSRSLSYRAEASLLYRLRGNFSGVLGVSYRGDSYSYKAKPYAGGTEQNFAQEGDVNKVSARGLGLSLGVNWAF